MRKTTDNHGHGFGGSVFVTVLVVGFILLILALLAQTFGPMLSFFRELGIVWCIMLFYVGALLAIAIGVVAALYQRWKEIQGGEEDEAKKY